MNLPDMENEAIKVVKSLWNKGRTSIQGKPCIVRSARRTARTDEVRAVLRHCVPYKGLHPLRHRRHGLRIIRFRLKPKAHSLRRSSSPHKVIRLCVGPLWLSQRTLHRWQSACSRQPPPQSLKTNTVTLPLVRETGGIFYHKGGRSNEPENR